MTGGKPEPQRQMEPAEADANRSGGGFVATVLAVLWSFFGVRRSAAHEADMKNLKPVHVIVVGILAAGVFVMTLIGVVKLVVP